MASFSLPRWPVVVTHLWHQCAGQSEHWQIMITILYYIIIHFICSNRSKRLKGWCWKGEFWGWFWDEVMRSMKTCWGRVFQRVGAVGENSVTMGSVLGGWHQKSVMVEQIGEVGRGLVVKGFAHEEDLFELDALWDREPVEVLDDRAGLGSRWGWGGGFWMMSHGERCYSRVWMMNAPHHQMFRVPHQDKTEAPFQRCLNILKKEEKRSKHTSGNKVTVEWWCYVSFSSDTRQETGWGQRSAGVTAHVSVWYLKWWHSKSKHQQPLADVPLRGWRFPSSVLSLDVFN